MGVTAENLAVKYELTREEVIFTNLQIYVKEFFIFTNFSIIFKEKFLIFDFFFQVDAFAIRSQQTWGAANEKGVFADEIVPVEIKTRKGKFVIEIEFK